MAKKGAQQETLDSSAQMSLEEARAYRAAMYRPEKRSYSETEKREEFRLFWAREKKKYSKSKNLEQILWVHLKACKLDSPEQFEIGLEHFGLKKVR